MREAFEVRDVDAAGRIGELRVPRAGVTVETPALLPVVNPHFDTVPPARLEREFGAEIIITNAYILYGSDEFREAALDRGVRDLLDFSGAIMTDSGAYQLSEYGEISVTTPEILAFQRDVGADIATPVDVPTPPDATRETAETDLEATRERLATAEDVETGEMLVTAPVQGSTYLDLRRRAAEHADATGLDVFPVGGVVPLLSDYRFADVVDVVVAAKRGLGTDAPVHLFGAGHPMMFALAVALGCDLFDSAAYALYARDDRYLTVRGTEHLEELDSLPCSCPVCTEHSSDDLRDSPAGDRESLLAAHNLHVSFGEMRRIRQCLRRGTLLELVEARARGHPAMLDGYRALLDHAGRLERSDPVSTDAFFYLSAESARRPEVLRHHDRLDRLSPAGTVLLAEDGRRDDDYEECWRVVPPFGPFPRELAETYPLTAEVPERTDASAREAAAEGVRRLVGANPGTEFTLVHGDWPDAALDRVPDRVSLDAVGSGDRDRSGVGGNR